MFPRTALVSCEAGACGREFSLLYVLLAMAVFAALSALPRRARRRGQRR